jgi:P pilus assembly chaperone PapD
MTMRSVTRVCAAGLLTAGVLALSTAPALAADVDFGVDIEGTTVALGSDGKQTTVTISNNGATKPSEVEIRFDVSDVDTADVTLSANKGVDLTAYAEDVTLNAATATRASRSRPVARAWPRGS